MGVPLQHPLESQQRQTQRQALASSFGKHGGMNPDLQVAQHQGHRDEHQFLKRDIALQFGIKGFDNDSHPPPWSRTRIKSKCASRDSARRHWQT